MKQRVLLLLLIVSGVSAGLYGQAEIKNGILDFRYSGVPEKTIELRGEWEFFWNLQLDPQMSLQESTVSSAEFVDVPSYWTDYRAQIPEVTAHGYATYRLRILLPQSYREKLMLAVPVFDSSFKLYVNGRFIHSSGISGTSFETTKPDYTPVNYSFYPQSDTIDVLIYVSNFHHRRGGFWLPMKFGQSEIVEKDLRQNSVFTLLSYGMLLAFSGFYFLFFLMFRNDRSMLYFSLSTLFLLLRSLFTGSFHILTFIDLNWHWLIKMEYLSSFLALLFAMWYFYYIYKDRYMPWINTAVSVFLVSGCLAVLLFPVTIFSYSIIIFIPLVILIVTYYAIRSLIAAIKEKGYAIAIAIGFSALLLGVANDTMRSTSTRLISSENILNHTLVFFMIMQVVALLYRWVLSVRKEKKLLEEIEFVNRNLENIVIDRTSELSNQKAELVKQKKFAEQKNIELEKNIAIKNRIFSIIAHDLKSPVLNLSLMIEHLRNNNDPGVQKTVINSISQQSGFAANLIDNLLMWGEGQRNRIAYNPERVNLTDLVLENFNLMMESANRKQISLTYSHKGDPTAICDSDLVNIIIRNTLSNSIKFTKANGTISVSVEEPLINDGMVYVRIKDNGIGIPEEKLSKIFSEEIVDSSPGTENEKGTGLGLQLCNDLVRINKGSISIESKEGRGTTIIISLPAPSKH